MKVKLKGAFTKTEPVMKLYYKDTDTEVKPGDLVTSFRGEVCRVDQSVGSEPQTENSTGRIHVIPKGFKNCAATYYPSVFGCEWRGA